MAKAKKTNSIFGWLCYPNQTQSDLNCLLKLDENPLKVIVPFRGDESEIAHWFLTPEYPFDSIKQLPSLPSPIWIEDIDSFKKYILVNPQIKKRSNAAGDIRGYALLYPKRIIISDNGIDYSTINTLRTSSPEYLHWLQQSVINISFKPSSDNSKLEQYGVSYETKPCNPIPHPEYELSFYIEGSDRPGNKDTRQFIVEERAYLESSSSQECAFENLIKPHHQLQNLLAILCWQDISFHQIEIKKDSDLNRYIDGSKSGPKFREVVTSEFHFKDFCSHEINFIFYFNDIGIEGLKKWFEIDSMYERALSRLSFLARFHSQIPLEIQVVEYGIMFEELGFTLTKKSNYSLANYIDALFGKIHNYNNETLLLSDTITSDIADTYNAIKHPDYTRKNRKPREDYLLPLWLLEVSYASRALLTMWISKELNCPANVFMKGCQIAQILNNITRWRKEI